MKFALATVNMKFKGGTIANKAGNCACAPQGKSEGKVIQSA
jgi:hypothetical protein